MNELREKLADLQHQQWSGWMEYLFSKCSGDTPRGLILPEWAGERWNRQMNTPYSELTESEKNSDRTEADKYLPIIESEKKKAVLEVLKRIETALNDFPYSPITMLREIKKIREEINE